MVLGGLMAKVLAGVLRHKANAIVGLELSVHIERDEMGRLCLRWHAVGTAAHLEVTG